MICNFSHHQQQKLIGACLNKTCLFSRLCCSNCVQEFHNMHQSEVKLIRQLPEWKSTKEQTLKTISRFMQDIQQFISLIGTLLNQIKVNKEFLGDEQTKAELEIDLEGLVIIEKFESQIYPQLKDLMARIGGIQKEWKQFQNIIESKKQVQEQKQQNQLEISLVQESINLKLSNIYEKYVDKLKIKFTPYFKHIEVTLDKERKKAKGNNFAFCEPQIPQNSITRVNFAFKGGNRIGICSREKAKINGFLLNLTQLGHGSYLIDNKGFTYSHHDESINEKKLSFQFSHNDIIICEVDMKMQKVSWLKQSTGKNFSMQFEKMKDFYPIVYVENQEALIVEEF